MAIKGSRAVTKCTWVPATVKYYYPLLLPSYLPNTGVLPYPRLALNSQQASYLSHHSPGITDKSPSPSFVFLLTPLPALIPQKVEKQRCRTITSSITLKTLPPNRQKAEVFPHILPEAQKSLTNLVSSYHGTSYHRRDPSQA